MRSEQSLSSQSSSFQSQRRHEESILQEYKRVSYGQESFYFSMEPIDYAPIPKTIPPHIASQFTHCLFLENYSFYEMFTFAIFEHLLRLPSEPKRTKLNKLKNLVCSDNFLSFASYMKGLILKGLQAMLEAEGSDRPAAETLMGSEKLAAFCECWKEMIMELGPSGSGSEEINSVMIGTLATFFDVDFKFFTRKAKDFHLEVIRSSKSTPTKTAVLHIVLIPSNSDEHEESPREESFSEISSIYGNWSYYILLNYPHLPQAVLQEIELPLSKQKDGKLKRHTTLLREYPELFAIDEESSQIFASRLHSPPQDGPT